MEITIQWFLAICGGIITVSGAIGAIVKWVNAAKKPSDDMKVRVGNLEIALADVNRKFAEQDLYFKRDKDRLDAMDAYNSEFRRMTITALQALTKHALDGNNVDELEGSVKEMDKFLRARI